MDPEPPPPSSIPAPNDAADPGTALTRARRDLVQLGRALQDEGLVVGTAGNLSVAVGDRLVLTPSSLPAQTTSADDLVVLDRDGRQLEGHRLPSSEWQLHLAVHAGLRPGAIVHTHSVAATAVSTLVETLPAIHYYTQLLGGPPRVAPYATFGTPELAANVVEALRDRTAALMANHGAVTIGATLQEAVDRARTLEWLCQVLLAASAAGRPDLLTADQLDAVDERMATLRRDLAAREATPTTHTTRDLP